MKIIGFLESVSEHCMRSTIPSLHHQNFEIKSEIATIETTEREDRLLARTPHVCRPLSKAQEWMHMIRALLCKQTEISWQVSGVQHCSHKQWSLQRQVLSPLPVHFFPSTSPPEVARPRPSPKRASRAFLSLRPRQIMIALISVDSRLSVLSRDIVTRQHEGQDNSQKSLSAVGTDEN